MIGVTRNSAVKERGKNRHGTIQIMKMKRYGTILVPFLFGCCGIVITLSSIFNLSQWFENIPGDKVDTWYNHYMLEHSYRWLRGDTLHTSFWDPPFFYPEKNVAAYSDILIGVAPYYWIWRSIGSDPGTAYQLWLITIIGLNYGALYVLLRHALKLRTFPSTIGAYIFACGGPVISQTGHPQLLPQFYAVVGIMALIQLHANKDYKTKKRQRRILIGAVFGSIVLQLYSGFYSGWFFTFGLCIALLWIIAVKEYRNEFKKFIKSEWKTISICMAIAVIVLYPMTHHYLDVARMFGYRGFLTISSMLPTTASYFYHGPQSLVYGWTVEKNILTPPTMEHEQRIGIGIVSMIGALIGLGITRNTIIRILSLTTITIIILSFKFSDVFTFWSLVYYIIPGAQAIRAVSRIGLLLLIPAGIGIALTFDTALAQNPTRKKYIAAVIVAALIMAEQVRTLKSYSKIEARNEVKAITQQIDTTCDAFFYSHATETQITNQTENERLAMWGAQLHAMWASMESGVPTLNGYSGHDPGGWQLRNSAMLTPHNRPQIAGAITQWKERKNLRKEKICWVVYPET